MRLDAADKFELVLTAAQDTNGAAAQTGGMNPKPSVKK